ncbi:hypothetical protein E4U21_001050 [Claviceps maximensis]|nr:hypothetical protein E4U21_001050 [Claviceps maximensis]
MQFSTSAALAAAAALIGQAAAVCTYNVPPQPWHITKCNNTFEAPLIWQCGAGTVVGLANDIFTVQAGPRGGSVTMLCGQGPDYPGKHLECPAREAGHVKLPCRGDYSIVTYLPIH